MCLANGSAQAGGSQGSMGIGPTVAGQVASPGGGFRDVDDDVDDVVWGVTWWTGGGAVSRLSPRRM